MPTEPNLPRAGLKGGTRTTVRGSRCGCPLERRSCGGRTREPVEIVPVVVPSPVGVRVLVELWTDALRTPVAFSRRSLSGAWGGASLQVESNLWCVFGCSVLGTSLERCAVRGNRAQSKRDVRGWRSGRSGCKTDRRATEPAQTDCRMFRTQGSPAKPITQSYHLRRA